MKQGLKIYACSGFAGVGTAAPDFDYWLDNTQTVSNTCAVNCLLAYINNLFAQLQYDVTLTDAQVIEALNKIDLYSVCLQYAKEYINDTEGLTRAGRIIAAMVEEGCFNYGSLDNDERDENLDALIAESFQRFNSSADGQTSSKFYRWYVENVVNLNYVGMSEEEQARWNAAANNVEGVSGTTTKSTDSAKMLTNAGGYFLGLYMSKTAVNKSTKMVQTKRSGQQKCYDYLWGSLGSSFGYKQDAFNSVITTGCLKSYEYSPATIWNTVMQKKGSGKEGIGSVVITATTLTLKELIELILMAVTVVLPAILKGIAAIIKVCTDADLKKHSLDIDPNKTIIDKDDLEAMYKNINELEAKNTKLKYVAIAAAGVAVIAAMKN